MVYVLSEEKCKKITNLSAVLVLIWCCDHVHCLVSLNDDLGIGKIAQLIKGESSHWINKNKLTKPKFGWQNEYFAMGVGDDGIQAVRNYISQQETHHQKHSWAQEYDDFIAKYGFDIVHKDLG